MLNDNELKEVVKQKYSDIAKQSGAKSCCGGSKKNVEYSMINDSYENLDGYVKEADLGLGCGVPTEFAGIKKGDTVVDLGSGAGNDVFVARSFVGEEGKVIGIDFSEDMVAKANENKIKVGYDNVEFKYGEIENMPLENDSTDVVISNCVLNLVPNKENAFKEIYRVLKPGAHLCVSDIVIKGKMTDELKKSAAMYAGCVSGALDQDDYIGVMKDAGFKNIEIKKTKKIELPAELLYRYLSEEGRKDYIENLHGIFSITVVAYK